MGSMIDQVYEFRFVNVIKINFKVLFMYFLISLAFLEFKKYLLTQNLSNKEILKKYFIQIIHCSVKQNQYPFKHFLISQEVREQSANPILMVCK